MVVVVLVQPQRWGEGGTASNAVHGSEWPPRGERYVALQIGFDAITSFNELITTVHKFNNDSFTFNDFISRALLQDPTTIHASDACRFFSSSSETESMLLLWLLLLVRQKLKN